MTQTEYRIQSSTLIHAPGMARWIADIRCDDANRDVGWATAVALVGEAPAWVAASIVYGGFITEGDEVIITKALYEPARERDVKETRKRNDRNQ